MLENWTCLIVTCPSLDSAVSTEKEINILKQKGRIPDSLCVLTVEDPAENIGSGAATLNALLVATEYLSAKQNYMVVSADVLYGARILILHNGRTYLYSLTGKAFVSLPLEFMPTDESNLKYSSGIVSNFESLLSLVDKLSRNSPPGVWVCSTDMMVLQREEIIDYEWQNSADVSLFCIPSDIKYATSHGVVEVDEQDFISNIFYCASESKIRKLAQSDQKVPLVSGIVYMSVSVAESLLSLHVQSPLDSCTYLGLDSGADPIQVSLFFDLLVAMSANVSKESFVAGKCGKIYNFKVGIDPSGSKDCITARSLVWDELSGYKMSLKMLSGCEHMYWSDQGLAKNHLDTLFRVAHSKKIHAVYEKSPNVSSGSLIVNSFIRCSGSCDISFGSAIYDCMFSLHSLSIGENCFLSRIWIEDEQCALHIPSNLVVINVKVKNSDKRSFIIVFGVEENLTSEVDSSATFCNKPLNHFLDSFGILREDLWSPSLSFKQKSLMNAKLFIPNLSLESSLEFYINHTNKIDHISKCHNVLKTSERYSIAEVLNMIDYSDIFECKRILYSRVSSEVIKQVLVTNLNTPLLPYFHAACAEGWHSYVMADLDKILLSDASSIVKTRTLSNMADLLGTMAGLRGGLRSGPGSNPSWSCGFSLLKKGDINEGLNMLKDARSKWLDRPDHIMRAARHYERAAQILIQRSVMSVTQFIELNPCTLPEIGVEIIAECPARIDLQGGWSDTPPICYELGGSVVNIAILVDDKKPIGAKAHRTIEPSIILKLGIGSVCREILLKHINDVLGYDQPNAQGALLKACLICAGIVDVNSNLSLPEQLLSKFGGGFVVQSWSSLPQGCGMGTSSILAGAIISVLWTVSGKKFKKIDVIHAVLYVEQLLTTGGGWQDQVSGIMGGVNRGYSKASLPLCVEVVTIPLPQDIIHKLNSHFLLIYTGKVRLAKNLLQNVVRNWYAREETVVSCFQNLITYSFEMKHALLKGDLEAVGCLMNEYWKQKKLLAFGCEPLIVKNMMERLKPICFGQILVGAGGGGFMCVLTKVPNAKESVVSLISDILGSQKMTFHTVTVDTCGLEVIQPQ